MDASTSRRVSWEVDSGLGRIEMKDCNACWGASMVDWVANF